LTFSSEEGEMSTLDPNYSGVMKFDESKVSSMRNPFLLVVLAAALALPYPVVALTSLTNNNSTLDFDFTSPTGMANWNVDSIDQLNQQWFYYRIGSGRQLDLTQITTSPTITFSGTRQVTALYSNAQYGVRLSYTLTGQTPGSNKSGLNETITLFNYSATALDFHFYMYSDFTLGGAAQAGTQSVSLGLGAGGSGTSVQTFGAPGNNSVVAITPPNHFQASITPALYNSLNTVNNYTLNDVATAGPGNVSWGWEWDFNLAPGSTQLSIIDTLAVPEPTALGLGLLGAVLVVVRRRLS